MGDCLPPRHLYFFLFGFWQANGFQRGCASDGFYTRHEGQALLADGSGGTTLEAINRIYEITGDIPSLKGSVMALRWRDLLRLLPL